MDCKDSLPGFTVVAPPLHDFRQLLNPFGVHSPGGKVGRIIHQNRLDKTAVITPNFCDLIKVYFPPGIS